MPNDTNIPLDDDFDPNDFVDFDPDVEFTDPSTVNEVDVVPPPTQPSVMARMPVPRARRLLKGEIEVIKTAIADIKKLELGERVQLGVCAIDAIVCATFDLQLPLTQEGGGIERYRQLAKKGELRSYCSLALDELEDTLVSLDAGVAALKAISVLDEPIPGSWDNLHPILLARKLNGLGHTLLRGRLAGVNL